MDQNESLFHSWWPVSDLKKVFLDFDPFFFSSRQAILLFILLLTTVILPLNFLVVKPRALWTYIETSLAHCDLTLKYPRPWPTVLRWYVYPRYLVELNLCTQRHISPEQKGIQFGKYFKFWKYHDISKYTILHARACEVIQKTPL